MYVVDLGSPPACCPIAKISTDDAIAGRKLDSVVLMASHKTECLPDFDKAEIPHPTMWD
jgi:hypothetical protein